MSDIVPRPSDAQQPRWQPLSAVDRRVLGVLVEKAKTTPDGYPMSVNSLRSGCNQKNNRYPLMELELEDVEESLSRLRALGAVAEVQGGGRVPRYRHYMYEWLGVEKLELAVMAELLLRGAQTEGELRGRAARMDPIPELNVLRPVLASLKNKGLIVSLTPEGRGHALTHALYEPRELEKVRAEFNSASPAQEVRDAEVHRSPTVRSNSGPPAPTTNAPGMQPRHVSADTVPYAPDGAVDDLRRQLEEVRAEVANLRKDIDDLWSNFR
ncbi:MAG TPA: DUF480 domain-containing protein [Pirellulales bacterium]|jgi:hypothetical protein|nr:DUF480 domain-containing protein [Pirellulales bacterium]